MPRLVIRHRVRVKTEIGSWSIMILQFLGGFFILLRQLNNLRKTRIRWEIKFVFFFQGPVRNEMLAFPSTTTILYFQKFAPHDNCFIHLLGHESSTKEVAPRKLPDALFRRSEANKHVRVQNRHAELSSVAAFDVPARWDVNRNDRQASAGDERERHVKRSAHGRLKREAEDRVKDDVTRCQRGRKRVLCQLGI
jgi:hypothetical protein